MALAFRQDLLARMWLLYALAAASFLTTLHLPYIGEEGVYTITSLEMWVNRDFLVPTLYGSVYGRPPLYNWLIIPFANLFGWDHVLFAARLVTACASILTGLVLAWLTRRLTGDRSLAAFAALIYLSGDVLFYRGWLAYSDPVFAFCVFAAIAALWVALHDDRPALVWLAMVALTCAFLSKVQTAYVFYGLSLLVLAARPDYRARLLRPSPIVAHIAGAAAFLAWHYVATRGANLHDTTQHLLHKASTVDVPEYLRQLALFPLETFARLLPASALAGWFWWRSRRAAAAGTTAPDTFPWKTLIWILALNWIPYWLGPRSHIRYILPLYPLFALLLAGGISRAGTLRIRQATSWLATAIALKYIFALWGFPAHQAKFRGDQVAAAAQIEQHVVGFPLYANDDSATGLAVTARIDERRYPRAPLRRPPPEWTDAFALSYYPEESGDQKIAETITLRKDKIYLLCRGRACSQPQCTEREAPNSVGQ